MYSMSVWRCIIIRDVTLYNQTIVFCKKNHFNFYIVHKYLHINHYNTCKKIIHLLTYFYGIIITLLSIICPK